jgi:hypothetical protein
LLVTSAQTRWPYDPCMTGRGESADGFIEVVLTAGADDPVETIVKSIEQRADSPRPRRGTLSEPAQMLIAGSISVRILAAGLLDWVRRAKDTTVFVDASEGETRIFSEQTANVQRLVFLRRDGSEGVFPVDTRPAEIEAEFEVPGR